MRSNVKTMKTKHFLVFALFITITVLLSGCGKADPKVESENAALKARLQKLEQQLQATKTQTAPQASPDASQDLKSQLDEAQKKAEAAADELTTLHSQIEAQNAKINGLTRDLANTQQARDKAEKALQLYQDKAASAIKEFKTLRSALGVTNILGGTNSLGGTNAMFDAYHQKYLATQKAVTNLAGVLPESKVRREILGVLAICTRINGAWETAAWQMQERTKTAQADYDKFVNLEGIGSNDYVIKLGKSKILGPAEQENAATASSRDQQMASMEKDLDLGIKNLQVLVNGQQT